MSKTAARLAELDAISRERSLTDDEQREVLRLAWKQRQTQAKNRRYASDPAWRERVRAENRDRMRSYLSDPAFRAARNAKRREARA